MAKAFDSVGKNSRLAAGVPAHAFPPLPALLVHPVSSRDAHNLGPRDTHELTLCSSLKSGLPVGQKHIVSAPSPGIPELGTCKSIFTSKSCTLNRSSERSLADFEFKSLSFPWPCNMRIVKGKHPRAGELPVAAGASGLSSVPAGPLQRLPVSLRESKESQGHQRSFWKPFWSSKH